MRISKTKFVAASFGAALTSLYAAPDLCADDGGDTNPDVGVVSFAFDGIVPLRGDIEEEMGIGQSSSGVQAAVNGLGTYGPNISISFFNNVTYGFGVAMPGASSLVTGTALTPGALFCGGLDGDDNPIPGLDRALPVALLGGGVLPPQRCIIGTGVHTVGFLVGGGIGYFRVDLGNGMEDARILDAQIALPAADGTNDFTITIPPVPDDGNPPLVLRGDVNLDGMVNFLDIAPFISRLAEMENQPEADVNEDGVVNFLDISPFIGVLANPSSMQVSWSGSTGKPLERFAAGNEVLEKQLQAIERKLQEELSTALAQTNSSAVESESASVGLAALALGATGLRRRRKATTAV